MTPAEAVAKVRSAYARPQPVGAPERAAFNGDYKAYLESPEWRAKAALVRARAKRTCEGCGVRPAVEVHHLTYAHIGCEFLFELVALCSHCHDRWHKKFARAEAALAKRTEAA